MRAVCVQAGGPEPRPDVHARCSSRGAQRLREPRANGCGAPPTRPTCPAAGASAAGQVWHGRVRARSTWLGGGRRERRERERGARAVRPRRAARATPTRPRQLELEGDGPRRGVLSPRASLVASRRGAWQIVAGRVRPLEKTIRRTARAPGARCGASGARPTRRAADLCFRSARNARLAPACPDGRFDRMMTLFLRWRTSKTTPLRCVGRGWGGGNRGSTDLNWTLIGVERVCRTFVTAVLCVRRPTPLGPENYKGDGSPVRSLSSPLFL